MLRRSQYTTDLMPRGADSSQLAKGHGMTAGAGADRIVDCATLSRDCFLRASEDADVKPIFVDAAAGPPTFRSIDDLGLPACDFIKVDVDGNERDVLASGLRTIARFRPVIYAENDVRERSPALLEFLLGLDYRLGWHLAPLYNPDNFAGYRENIWEPKGLMSAMILAIPAERRIKVEGWRPITDPGDWWADA